MSWLSSKNCLSFQEKLEKASETEAAYQAWQDARRAVERWEGIAAQFRQQQQQRQAPLLLIEAERARLQQEHQTLSGQDKEVAALQAEAPELDRQLAAAQLAGKLAIEQLAQRDELLVKKDQHMAAQAEAKAENPRLKSEMEELKSRIDELESTTSPVCPLCAQPLSEEHRTELIVQLNAQGKQLGERYRENLALLKEFETTQHNMETELAALSNAEGELRQQNRAADQLSSKLKQIDQKLRQWEETGKPRLAEVSRLLQQGGFALDAQAQLAAVDAELKAIGYDPQAHEQARQEESRGREAETSLRELENARAALAPLERELANLQEQLTTQKRETDQNETAYQQAARSYAAASENLPDLKKAEDELFNLQEQENRLRMDVGAANQKVAVLEVLEVRRKSLGEEREEWSRRINRLKTLERAFGKDGVPALLIEQALPEIERQANQILDRLSGGNMSVRFLTQREFKDKHREDLKETLDIQISDSAGARDYEMFSGGEAFRVNFAIRLALSRVLAQRAGARLQTLVIDEGFGSQDAQGRQRLIEAINLVHKDFAKILVITHLDELKEAFPYRLEVEKTPHGSIVKGF